tara:strand:- start:1280 stop:2287 length:1008 start_codon:yes stop_codon:yes gene_type:complete
VPANLGKVLRYPEDLIDHTTDYFQIEVLKNPKKIAGFDDITDIKTSTKTVSVPGAEGEDPTTKEVKTYKGGMTGLFKGGLDSGAIVQASDKYQNLPVKQVIILPIPQNIKDNNGATWGESKLNDFAAWGLGKMGEAMAGTGREAIDVFGDVIQEAGKAAKGSRGSQVFGYTKMVAAASALNSLGGNVSASSLLSRASGQIVNQNVEMVFSGVTVRSFNFSWDLVPRSKDESMVLERIIKTLKQSSAAKMDNKGIGFLNAPDIFRLNYMQGGKKHPFLHRFKTCAMKNIAMNYTASGTYATYNEGTPVHMKMDLAFTEFNPIYAEDHDKVDSGVGY